MTSFLPAVTPRRLVLLVLLVSLWLTAMATSALAHTQLDASDPADGGVAEGPVDTVILTMSRAIELLPDGIEVVGDPGRVADVTRSDDGAVVTVRIEPPLDDGAWQLSWRVLAEDSHPRDGTITFDVRTTTTSDEPSRSEDDSAITTPPEEGQSPDDAPDRSATAQTDREAATPAAEPAASATPPADDASSSALEVGASVARVVFYLGLMAAAGLSLFKAWPHRGERPGAHRLSVAILAGAGIALVASTVEVALHVASVSGSGIAGTLDPATWQSVLATGLGTALVVRTIGLALLVAGAARRWRARAESGVDLLLLAGSGLAVASFQFVGHTASAVPAAVVRTADAVHAVAAAVWVGGLVGLALLARSEPDSRLRTVARFSSAATIAVAAVAAAGVALAWVNLPDAAAMWTTGYGRLLTAKLALVGVLGAVGAYNHFAIVPRAVTGDAAAAIDLRRTVIAEVTLVVIVVVLTGLLVNTSPT